MAFWIIIALGSLTIAALLGSTMLRRRPSVDAETEHYDMRVYRDQLQEVDRDLKRGTLNPGEADRARVEISRRLLATDRALEGAANTGAAPKAANLLAIAISAAVIIGGGFVTYDFLGVNAPGQTLYADMPLSDRLAAAADARENRPSQQEIEASLPAWPGPPAAAPADYIDLVERLRQAVAERPDEVQGLELLAQHEGRLSNHVAAHQAMAQVMRLRGENATAQDFAEYADMLILAANGEVSPEAEQALTEALRRDPKNHVARYYSGLMFAQIGRYDLAFRLWRDLLEDSPPNALWVSPIRAQIGQLAAMAGVNYTLPELAAPATSGLAGPSTEDMAAMADLSAEDRAVMVEGMVAQLSERLARQGGTASEWAQLIGALATLDQTERAAAIWLEAQGVFAARPDELAIIRGVALRAGLPDTPRNNEQGNQRALDNMVTNLTDRLATEGGPPEDWIRLIDALSALGEAGKAASIWAEAQKAFAEAPEQLEQVRAAAARAGVAE